MYLNRGRVTYTGSPNPIVLSWSFRKIKQLYSKDDSILFMVEESFFVISYYSYVNTFDLESNLPFTLLPIQKNF